MIDKCPVCSFSSKLKYRLKGNIFKCINCDLLYAKNINFDSDKIEIINPEIWFNNISNLRRKNFEIIIKNINNEQNLKKGFEVGSSTGLFIEMCEQENIICSGIEPEERAFKISEKKGLNVIKGFFPQDLPKENNKYDFIIFNDVFEHIPDVQLNINNIKEHLTINGYLILNLPVSTGFFYKISKIMNFFGFEEPLERLWQFNFYTPHFFYFNKKSMLKLAELNGFEIVNYHKLHTLSKEDISYRINSDKSLAKFSWLLVPIIKTIIPFLNFFEEDIGVFYLKRV